MWRERGRYTDAMPATSTLLIVLLAAVVVAIVLLVVLLLRKPDAALANLRERLEDALREEQRSGRGELRETLEALARAQNSHMEGFSTRLADFDRQHAERFGGFRDALGEETRQARSEAGEMQLRHNTALTARVLPSLARVVGREHVIDTGLTMGAEDFSYYAQRVPGFFFFVGATPRGKDPATAPSNHSPKFLLDESSLDIGFRALLQVSLDYLHGGQP